MSKFPIEPDTSVYLAGFASQPPREDQTLEDLRAGYKAELIRCASSDGASLASRFLKIAGGADEINARLYLPDDASEGLPLLLYAHGGGFAVGDLDSHDGLARLIFRHSGMAVLTMEYRRAPESPFPAARDDVLAAFRWVINNAKTIGVDGARVVLGGESAGAAHAMTAALALRSEEKGPCAVWVMSPALDATTSGESYKLFETGAGRTTAEFAYLWSLYAPDSDSHADPAVSPSRDDPEGLPPLFIYTAEYDPARSDGEDFALKAQAAGVSVVCKRREGLIHQYPEITGISRASHEAVVNSAKELAAFVSAIPK
jgi:acetyl esterase